MEWKNETNKREKLGKNVRKRKEWKGKNLFAKYKKMLLSYRKNIHRVRLPTEMQANTACNRFQKSLRTVKYIGRGFIFHFIASFFKDID